MSSKSLNTSFQKLYYKRKLRNGSFNKSNASEDSDSEDDEQERRKYISLKGGQCLLWSANKFGTNNFDLSQNLDLKFNEYSGNGVLKNVKNNSFKRNVDGRHSLRQLRLRSRPLNLDSIQINNEFEYGFNPKRPSGSKADHSVRLRPISLYSPPPQRERHSLKPTLSDAEKYSNSKETGESYTPEHFLKRTVSYARNDYEAQLEKKVLSLRAQPSNLKFQGSKGKLNEQELAEDIANARRRRFVRRQLSFDSHPRKQWKKTLSLDSGLATDSLRSLKGHSFVRNDSYSKSDDFLLNDSISSEKVNGKVQRTSKSVEFLDVQHDSPRDNIDAQSDNTITASCETDMTLSSCDTLTPTSQGQFKVLPPPQTEESVTPVVLLGNSEKSKTEKSNRRKSFPHFLGAFRLPNKETFRKFIRKKTPEPICISYDETSDPGKDEASPSSLTSPSTPEEFVNKTTSARSISTTSTNSMVDEEMAGSTEKLLMDKSCSSYSLPRVDEDKESFEFSSPLERRSKSSNSISFSKNHQPRPSLENPGAPLQRRLSDTVLSSNHRSIGCSPGRKFVRKLLSPVVCGMHNTPERYGMLADSMQSLQSYDSSSITSDSDITYPQLFDFGSQELAEEMTLIDKELLVRISWEELSILGWMSSDKFVLAPNIMKMVQFFNRIAMLVSTSILSEETIFRRAKIIRKAIKLAARCRYGKNYNSLKAVLGGLQCTPIFRLKSTWKQVPSRYRRMFRELSELMSESNNFSIYRQELTTSLRNPPCIPFLGNFLTQVAHTHAYMAVQVKLKSNSFVIPCTHQENHIDDDEDDDDDDDSMEDMNNKTLTPEPNRDVNGLITSKQEGCVVHTRSDSDDSGVVLNLNRLSHTSDELEETSPREISSPDEETKAFDEDVFNKQTIENYNTDIEKPAFHINGDTTKPGFHLNTRSPVTVKKCKSFQNVNMKPTSSHKKSISVDHGSRITSKQFNDIATIINNKPVERVQGEIDELYECELMFWKYQISSVQYNIIPRSYIRRYLMNSPYNTEEENYKLSLKREPPVRN